MTGGRPRVLLADGAPPAALAVARSLVGAGYAVEATRDRPSDRAPRSRGVLPRPMEGPHRGLRRFADALLEACGEGERPLLLPCSDAALLAVETRRREFEAAAVLPLPGAAVLERMLDKSLTLEAARAAGVAVPRTAVLRGTGNGDGLDLSFPVVAKPVRSKWALADGTVRSAGALHAPDAAALRVALRALREEGAPGALVQEYVPGTGRGVGVLMRAGAPAALFVHRRLREVHPAGGPSAAAVAEPPDPALVEPAVALLREMGWEGLAMVEFRREGAGAPVLMEVNGRPWGTLQLAVSAGVDFPRLWAEGYAGPPPPWRAGRRVRWLAGDLRRTATVFRGPPPGYPGRWPSRAGALADLLLGWAPDLVFRWGDPGPFLAEMRGGAR